jgi:hypothetical protein
MLSAMSFTGAGMIPVIVTSVLLRGTLGLLKGEKPIKAFGKSMMYSVIGKTIGWLGSEFWDWAKDSLFSDNESETLSNIMPSNDIESSNGSMNTLDVLDQLGIKNGDEFNFFDFAKKWYLKYTNVSEEFLNQKIKEKIAALDSETHKQFFHKLVTDPNFKVTLNTTDFDYKQMSFAGGYFDHNTNPPTFFIRTDQRVHPEYLLDLISHETLHGHQNSTEINTLYTLSKTDFKDEALKLYNAGKLDKGDAIAWMKKQVEIAKDEIRNKYDLGDNDKSMWNKVVSQTDKLGNDYRPYDSNTLDQAEIESGDIYNAIQNITSELERDIYKLDLPLKTTNIIINKINDIIESGRDINEMSKNLSIFFNEVQLSDDIKNDIIGKFDELLSNNKEEIENLKTWTQAETSYLNAASELDPRLSAIHRAYVRAFGEEGWIDVGDTEKAKKALKWFIDPNGPAWKSKDFSDYARSLAKLLKSIPDEELDDVIDKLAGRITKLVKADIPQNQTMPDTMVAENYKLLTKELLFND